MGTAAAVQSAQIGVNGTDSARDVVLREVLEVFLGGELVVDFFVEIGAAGKKHQAAGNGNDM